MEPYHEYLSHHKLLSKLIIIAFPSSISVKNYKTIQDIVGTVPVSDIAGNFSVFFLLKDFSIALNVVSWLHLKSLKVTGKVVDSTLIQTLDSKRT